MAAGNQAQKGICALLVILVSISRVNKRKNLWLVFITESQEPVSIIKETLIIIKLSPTRFDNMVIIPALFEFWFW
jgi:hypothetical protein